MMKQLIVLVLCIQAAYAALFIQRDDIRAQFLWNGGNGHRFLNGPFAAFTDSVLLDEDLYPTYGIRYSLFHINAFHPSENWLLVTDPISNNYRDFATPIFSITSTTVGGFRYHHLVNVPRNPFSAFHAVVVSTGPDVEWLHGGDIVIFKAEQSLFADPDVDGETAGIAPFPINNYDPFNLFGRQFGGDGTDNLDSGSETPHPRFNQYVCLGHPILQLNLGEHENTRIGVPHYPSTAAGNAGLGADSEQHIRFRKAYCLIREDDVVAMVDLNRGDSTSGSVQGGINNQPTEIGLVGLAS